jgi:hypothetical protein
MKKQNVSLLVSRKCIAQSFSGATRMLRSEDMEQRAIGAAQPSSRRATLGLADVAGVLLELDVASPSLEKACSTLAGARAFRSCRAVVRLSEKNCVPAPSG